MESFGLLRRLYEEQCVAPESAAPEKIELQEKPSSSSLQSPSDPDVTYGHKGKGYEVQLTETCGEENPFEVVTSNPEEFDVTPGEMLPLLLGLLAVLTALLALPFALIVVAITALAIKLDSPGPVFYAQERMGLDAKPFWCLKFRSMRTDAERDGPGWSAK